jgi:hypothetical protein
MSKQPDADRASEIASLACSAWGSAMTLSRVAPLAGDASSRRYLRAWFTGPGPETAVVMIPSGSGLSVSSDELAVFEEPLREMPFLDVQRYLRAAGIAVPEVYAVAPDESVVLLEDVGDVTLWDAAAGRGEEEVLSLYREAIDELVRLEAAGEARHDPSCIAFRQTFDARLFLWELDHFLEYGFAGRPIADGDRAELRGHFADLAEDLAKAPQTLAHRDYHSWNLFVHRGRIRVIDFQDALVAPLPYDLATLLNDRATPRLLTPPRQRRLIEHFLARHAERTASATPLEEFLPVYHRFVFQKALKVVGRFNYLEDVKGKRGYRAMLPDTLATVRRCLDALPELAEVRAILSRSLPEVI